MSTSLGIRFARLVNQCPPALAPRGVTRSGRRVRGVFASTRFNGPMHWESPLQWDLLYRLEASWLVSDACSRSATMNVVLDDSTSFQYTPHAVAMLRDDQMVCLQCIPAADLMDSTLTARHAAIRAHLAHLGVLFQAVSEGQLSHSAARHNARVLAQALRSARPREHDTKDCMQLARSRPTTFASLEGLLGRTSSLRMLALGHAYFNVHEKLDAATPLTFDLEEHFDAADFIHAK